MRSWMDPDIPRDSKAIKNPLTARILQVTVVYDDLTTDRPDRAVFPAAQAFAVIREEVERGWWDMSLVEEFERLITAPTPGLPEKEPSYAHQ